MQKIEDDCDNTSNRESEELNPTNGPANALQDDCDSSHCQQSDATSVDTDSEKLEKENEEAFYDQIQLRGLPYESILQSK